MIAFLPMIDFLKLATPIVLSIIIDCLMSMTDLLMIGHLGVVPVAAVAISTDLFVIFYFFPAGIAYGLQPFIEKLNHRTIYENSKWFFNSLCINLLASVTFCSLLLYMIHWLPYLKQDAQAVAMVSYYMPWLAFGILPTMICNTFYRYLEGLTYTKPIWLANMIGLIINVLLNYLFIHLKVGHFTNGLIGAGLATLCSKCIIALVLMPYVWKRLATNPKNGCMLSYFDRQYIKKLLMLGTPIGIQLLFEFVFLSITSLMVGNISVLHKGSNAILDSIVRLPIAINWGFSLAASALVKSMGYADEKAQKKFIWICYGTTGIVILLLTFSILHNSFFIFTACYAGSAIGYSMIYSSIPLAMLFILVDGFYAISLGLLRGLKDTCFPFFIATLSNWFIGMPLCYWFIKIIDWGIPSIWLSKIIAFLISGTILFVRFLKKYNEKKMYY